MARQQRILFLTLRTFSATGGIEKVCRVVSRVLSNWITTSRSPAEASLFSMYDAPEHADARYLGAVKFRGFSLRRLSFIGHAWREGLRSDVILLSHINLLVVATLIRLFRWNTRIYLIAHGIEVWRSFPVWKVWALKKTCTKIVAVSSFTRDDMIRRFQLDPAQVVVVPNGLDPLLAPRASVEAVKAMKSRLGFQPGDQVLLTLTRIAATEGYKGYDQVIRLLPELIAQYPTLQYVLVGKYDQAEHDRIQQLAQQHGVSNRVHFTGFVSDEDIPACFQLADVYVMPSKKEGFGLVFIEAMFYGTPVVAGNKDGSTQALDFGRLGTLVDPDSDESIRAGIEQALRKRDVDTVAVEAKFGFPIYEQHLRRALALPVP